MTSSKQVNSHAGMLLHPLFVELQEGSMFENEDYVIPEYDWVNGAVPIRARKFYRDHISRS